MEQKTEEKKVRVTSKNINVFARKVCIELGKLGKDQFLYVDELGKLIGLTRGQTISVCKYIKDCSREKDYKTYINFFIISSKNGYALLKNCSNDIVAKCYKKLCSSSIAERKRINPIAEFLKLKGYDLDDIELEEDDFSAAELEIQNAFIDSIMDGSYINNL